MGADLGLQVILFSVTVRSEPVLRARWEPRMQGACEQFVMQMGSCMTTCTATVFVDIWEVEVGNDDVDNALQTSGTKFGTCYTEARTRTLICYSDTGQESGLCSSWDLSPVGQQDERRDNFRLWLC